MYCSKCGANVADGTAFCSACGQPMVGFSVGGRAAAAAAANSAPSGGTVYDPAAQGAWQASPAAPVAYAGFWLRFVAAIIDGLLLYFVAMILFLPFGGSTVTSMRGVGGRPENLFPLLHTMIRLTFLRTILHWLYYSLLESSVWQATLGVGFAEQKLR